VAFAIFVSSEIALIASRRRASLACVGRVDRLAVRPSFPIPGSALVDVHSASDLNCGASCEGKFTRGHGRDRASSSGVCRQLME
jgi:hypothetical protein